MSHHLASVCTSLGGPDSLDLTQLPDEALVPGHVRVAVRAAGVNFPDYLLTKGEYQLKLKPPFVPGMEVSGVVLEVADDETSRLWPVGTPVIVSTRLGGFSEQLVAPSASVFRMPTGFSPSEGATFLVAARTAHHALVERGALHAGETVLVLGATGGVGMAAVQLGSLLGATVVAVGSDDAKLDVARTLGAARVLNYRDTDLVTAFRDQIGHADLVLDTVGGDLASDAMRLLGWRGRYLTAGFASGTIPQFAANRLLLKEASVLGVRAGEAARRDPGQAAHSIADLLALADSGALRPYICRRFHLTDAASALRTLAERRVVGRVALTMEGLT